MVKSFQCDPKLKPELCELAILRNITDKQKLRFSRKKASSPEIKKMLQIVEMFLKKKKLICYGGVSINAILPERKQFYNYDIEIPDYAFLKLRCVDTRKRIGQSFCEKGIP